MTFLICTEIKNSLSKEFFYLSIKKYPNLTQLILIFSLIIHFHHWYFTIILSIYKTFFIEYTFWINKILLQRLTRFSQTGTFLLYAHFIKKSFVFNNSFICFFSQLSIAHIEHDELIHFADARKNLT